ncbi:MAG TPA: hypothetical protein VEX38_06880, partial [Fimbriimonadaceae bacterium]|nr:hypothetical protein [Fimbriimonadaceae bacterium]
QRPKGSQAVFAAFVLDVGAAKCHLYQVGDVSAIIHRSDGGQSLVVAPPKGRWSTASKSPHHLKCTVWENLRGIVIKSDGASEEWGQVLDGHVHTDSVFGMMAEERARVDDVSYVAVTYREINLAGLQPPPLHQLSVTGAGTSSSALEGDGGTHLTQDANPDSARQSLISSPDDEAAGGYDVESGNVGLTESDSRDTSSRNAQRPSLRRTDYAFAAGLIAGVVLCLVVWTLTNFARTGPPNGTREFNPSHGGSAKLDLPFGKTQLDNVTMDWRETTADDFLGKTVPSLRILLGGGENRGSSESGERVLVRLEVKGSNISRVRVTTSNGPPRQFHPAVVHQNPQGLPRQEYLIPLLNTLDEGRRSLPITIDLLDRRGNTVSEVALPLPNKQGSSTLGCYLVHITRKPEP